MVDREQMLQLQELLVQYKKSEEELLCVCSHWSKLRENIIATFESTKECRNKNLLVMCQNAAVVGGLAVASASVVLTRSFLTFAAALGVTAVAVAGFHKGCRDSELHHAKTVLTKAAYNLNTDRRETNGVLASVGKAVMILNEIKKLISSVFPEVLHVSAADVPFNYQQIMCDLDLCLKGDESSLPACMKQCEAMCLKKLSSLHDLQKALQSRDDGMVSYESVWDKISTTEKSLYSQLTNNILRLLSFGENSECMDGSVQNRSEGFEEITHSEEQESTTAVEKYADNYLCIWLKEKEKYLQNTLNAALDALTSLKL